jgi:aminoglycoside/choline kinase family phosphotransferase
MSEIDIISTTYKELSGDQDIIIIALPKSGSDRKYFRITAGNNSVIGAYNSSFEENEAFVGFTKHFRSRDLQVPEIYGYFPEKHIYFLQDLGDTSLYIWLKNKLKSQDFDKEAEVLFKKIIDNLILFQIKGIDGLNLDLCYPHRSFDRQSMMWDMNYFKYMFLKLVSAPFNERKLENDFNILADFLLQAEHKYFLYRDFQSANIMVIDREPWFIDYQGGRKGAPQYDLASLLFDAKCNIPQTFRELILDYYISNFCEASGEERDKFRDYYTGFIIIRLMQALGAFGFRGLYENKPTFTGSIIPAVRILLEVIDFYKIPVHLPELYNTIRAIPGLERFINLSKTINIYEK